jgi:hypothetical protein
MNLPRIRIGLPRSLVGRMVLLLGIALAIAQLANFGLILNERQKLSLAQNDGPAITRFAVAAADMAEADPAFREAMIADLSHRGARYAIRADSGIAEALRSEPTEARLAQNLRDLDRGGAEVRATAPRSQAANARPGALPCRSPRSCPMARGLPEVCRRRAAIPGSPRGSPPRRCSCTHWC